MKIHRLTRKSVRPYGSIIDSRTVRYKSGDNGFGVLFRERSKGWRIAYLVVRRRKIVRLESHPNTAETFEPVKGRAIIALAAKRSPGRFKVFLLDKPVILKKGIWHNVAALTAKCEIKICEGIEVVEAYHDLSRAIVP